MGGGAWAPTNAYASTNSESPKIGSDRFIKSTLCRFEDYLEVLLVYGYLSWVKAFVPCRNVRSAKCEVQITPVPEIDPPNSSFLMEGGSIQVHWLQVRGEVFSLAKDFG